MGLVSLFWVKSTANIGGPRDYLATFNLICDEMPIQLYDHIPSTGFFSSYVLTNDLMNVSFFFYAYVSPFRLAMWRFL